MVLSKWAKEKSVRKSDMLLSDVIYKLKKLLSGTKEIGCDCIVGRTQEVPK